MTELGEWHGWSVGEGSALHIGHLPTRKSVALYVHEGTEVHVLAYFRDEESAKRALTWLDDAFAPRYAGVR